MEKGLNNGEVEDNLEQDLPSVDQEQELNDADILGCNNDEVMNHVENIDEIVCNAEKHANAGYNNGELAKYRKLIDDSKKPFYPGCDV